MRGAHYKKPQVDAGAFKEVASRIATNVIHFIKPYINQNQIPYNLLIINTHCSPDKNRTYI